LGCPMEKDYLILKRASASRPSGEWNDDDFDVLEDGEVVGRIFKANAVPVGSPWMWTRRQPTAMPQRARRQWRHSLNRGKESKWRLLTRHPRRAKLPLPPKGSGPYTGGRTLSR